MSRRIDLAAHLFVGIGDDGVAELVFGPEGGMPATDAQGTVWPQLASEPGARDFGAQSGEIFFCAGGTPDVVQGMLDSHAVRLRVMQEGRAIIKGMIDCDLSIVSAISRAKIIDGRTQIGVEAERIGLVSLTVPDSELLARSREIARSLAQGSPTVIAFTKRNVNHWLRSAWSAFEHFLAFEILSFSSADAREGFFAINEKRLLHFTGL